MKTLNYPNINVRRACLNINIRGVFITAAFIVIITALIFIFGFVKESKSLALSANVTGLYGSSSIGISLDTDELDFGVISAGSVSRKSVKIANNANVASKYRIFAAGSITPFVNVSHNMLYLAPFEQMEVEITVSAKEPGSFSGRLVIQSATPKNRLLEVLLPWA